MTADMKCQTHLESVVELGKAPWADAANLGVDCVEGKLFDKR